VTFSGWRVPGGSLEPEALSDLVVEFDSDLVAERVGGVPCLGDSRAVGLVGVLAIKATKDVRFRVTVPVDLEGDISS